MTNILNQMLPIYSLRERRAQRLVHEKRKDYELAQTVLLDTQEQCVSLQNESKFLLFDILTRTTVLANEAQWKIDHAKQLLEKSENVKVFLPNFEQRKNTAFDVLIESNRMYAQKVRKTDAVSKASKQLDFDILKVQTSGLEQDLEDDFSLIRAYSNSLKENT